jgi:hypothetical protein
MRRALCNSAAPSAGNPSQSPLAGRNSLSAERALIDPKGEALSALSFAVSHTKGSNPRRVILTNEQRSYAKNTHFGGSFPGNFAGAPERVRRVRTASGGASTPPSRFAINRSVFDANRRPRDRSTRNRCPVRSGLSDLHSGISLSKREHQRVRDRVPRNRGMLQAKATHLFFSEAMTEGTAGNRCRHHPLRSDPQKSKR